MITQGVVIMVFDDLTFWTLEYVLCMVLLGVAAVRFKALCEWMKRLSAEEAALKRKQKRVNARERALNRVK